MIDGDALRKQAAATVLRREKAERQAAIEAEAERLRREAEQRRLAEMQNREREEALDEAQRAVPRYMEALRSFMRQVMALEGEYGALRALRDDAAGAVSWARHHGAVGLPDMNPDVGPSMTFPELLQTISATWTPDEYNAWSREIDRARREGGSDDRLLQQAVPQEPRTSGADEGDDAGSEVS